MDIMEAATAHTPSALQAFSRLSENSVAVGSTWMLSSMVFTTYYSTAFLKYGSSRRNEFKIRQLISSIDDNNDNESSGSVVKRHSLLTKYYSRPQLLTIFRFSGSFFLGIFGHPNLFSWRNRLQQCIQSMKSFMIPATFMFLANYCNNIALDRLGISLTYTSKCGIPILTVLITIIVDGIGSIPPTKTLLTLIPIAMGIAMASWNTPTFDLHGFLAAITSATAQAALNVSCKRALTKTKTSGLQAQTTMAALAFCIAMITTTLNALQTNLILRDKNEVGNKNKMHKVKDFPPKQLLIGAVCSYHVEYVLSFLFLSLVKPITYGTCDAIRRLGIIISGRHMFGGEAFSMINYAGIGFALVGALGYSLSSS